MDQQETDAQPIAEKIISKVTYKNVTWWVILLSAVLAVPSFAIILSVFINATGTNQILIFILSCWLCIFLGLRLVKDPRVMPMLFERITLSPQENERCVEMVGMIEEEMVGWQKHYEKYEPVFMNLARQPAWGYLEEATGILARIRQSITAEGTIAVPDIRALNTWVSSAKPQAIDGYLRTLQSAYAYARGAFFEQQKNIDEMFPNLGNGHMEGFLSVPSHVRNFAHELLNTIKNEQPVLAARLTAQAVQVKEATEN